MLSFFIPYNVPSLKGNYKIGQYGLYLPKTITDYYKNTKPFWISEGLRFKPHIYGMRRPYSIELTFTRKTESLFDYINMAQIVQDQMVYYRWVDEDNIFAFKPYFGQTVFDKTKPGVTIKIITEVNIQYL